VSHTAQELCDALRDCMACMDSLRDYVAEGGSIRLLGAAQAIRDADAALERGHAALAKVARDARA
jgi:hypothetical protein